MGVKAAQVQILSSPPDSTGSHPVVKTKTHGGDRHRYRPDTLRLLDQKKNARHRAILGRSVSSANRMLLRMIVFRLLERLDEARCFRCGQPMTVADYSIDHLVPWRGGNGDAFWDLDEISFSHEVCNRLAAVQVPTARKWQALEGPAGTAWCGGHEAFLPVADFTKNKARWNGLQDECRTCRSRRRSPRKHGGMPESGLTELP